MIEDLTAQIQNLQTQIEAKQHCPKSFASKHPKPSLPESEKFNSTVHKFDMWDTVIQTKLAIDGAAIGDPIAQFYYVSMNLSSQVQAMVFPQLITIRASGEYNFETILDQLTCVYNNPNKIEEVEERLPSIRQDSSDSIGAYISRFERLLYESKGEAWTDATKIGILYKGLILSMCRRLSQQLNLSKSYPDFVRVVQQLATHTTSGSDSGNDKPSTSKTGYSDGSDAMDTSAGAVTMNAATG